MRRPLPALALSLVVLLAASPALAQPAPSPFESARAAALAGQPGAEAELRALAASVTASAADRRDAWHLLARLLDRAGPLRAADAADAWRHALELGGSNDAPSRLLDHLRFGLARALVAARGPEAGDEPLELFAAVERDVFSPRRPEAALARARHLEVLGRVPEAKKAYASILERWPESPVVPAVKARLAVVDGVAAVATLAPASADVAPARLSLDAIRALLKRRAFPEADLALAPWLVEPPPDAPRAAREAWLEALGLELDSHWESFRFKDALALHDKLKAKKKPGLSLDRLIKLHAYDGDFPKAKKLLLQKFRNKKSKAYWAALGDLSFEHARYAEAYDAYVQAWGKKGKEPPQTERMSWCLLRMGKSDKAKSAFAKLGKTRGFNKNLYDRYWYGRSLQLGKKPDDARPIFEGLVEDAPLEYYGHLAWSRLQEMDGAVPAGVKPPPPQAVASNLKLVDPPEIQPAVGWSEVSLAPPWDAAPRPAALADIEAALTTFAGRWGDAAAEGRRALELVRLGDLAAARAELRVIDMDLRALRMGGVLGNRARSDLLDNRGTPKARGGASMREPGRKGDKEVAAFKRGAGEIRAGLREVQVLLADPYALRRSVVEKVGWQAATPEVLDSEDGRRFYPLAYPEIVEPLATQFGIPAYFVYAIMTVESAFHSGAVSVADAYGLVQVIPRTGEHLANELGFVDFTPEILLEPPNSIYFGGYYLSRLLTRFRGQEPLAAAAYNAGPHRVATWLMARGTIDLDMFVEDIPYDQARNYVKTVIEHIAAYRRVYHGEGHVYVTNTIRADMGDGPNY
ncbi:MAG: lytic transglycosylase domain-containing protein [Deltaproteobacteria bacterium]|nr:lytic transglycosylase domain-containing protein [Deltaproteobacteria bacterium]